MKFIKIIAVMTLIIAMLAGCTNQMVTQSTDQSLVLLPTSVKKSTTISTDKTGIDASDVYYYSFWKKKEADGGYTGTASVTINTGKLGNYTAKWTNVNNFTTGKGWRFGTPDRIVKYSATFNPREGGDNNGYLALYGWAKTSIATPADYSVIEYYIIESYGDWTPPGGTQIGNTFDSDGGSYKVYKTERKDAPWIVNSGTGDFYQYWSVRTAKRTNGTITFSKHVQEWAARGLTLNDVTPYYQILESEGYHSSGSSEVTVCEVLPQQLPSSVIKLMCDDGGKIFTSGSTSGSKILCRTYNGTWPNQGFKIETVSGNIVRIKCNYYTYQGYLAAASSADNAEVQAKNLNTSDNLQKWEIVFSADRTTVKFKNVSSGKYMTAESNLDNAGVKCKTLDNNLKKQNWWIKRL